MYNPNDHHHTPNPGCGDFCSPIPDCPPYGPPTCEPLPPPIPPVRYIPGMNVQEQLNSMANHVNVCIDRWNQIQHNCYQALENVVGAAVNNDVYYAPDEVRFESGFSADDDCPYYVIKIKAVDKAGKPIFVRLRTAYENAMNTGARQNIEEVSFQHSANAIITAVNPTGNGWNGTTVINSNPAPYNEAEGWVCGFNREGCFMMFPGTVNMQTLRQNRMVDCIGPVIPIIVDGEISPYATAASVKQGSIQAVGFNKHNGHKVFFSCSNEENPGMSIISVAKVLQQMGCTTAAVTCYQVNYGDKFQMPVLPDENAQSTQEANADYNIKVIGLTGGMEYIGEISDAPLEWQIPTSQAFWVVSKRPMDRGWRNKFTSEIADVCQRLGVTANEMKSIQGKLNSEAADLLELKTRMSAAEADIQNHANQINTLQSEMTDVQTRVSNLETNVADLNNQLLQETQDRISGDSKLTADLNAEIERATAAETDLQTNINNEVNRAENVEADLQKQLNTEQQERTKGDSDLLAAINNEIIARQTADTRLQTSLEAETAAREKADTALSERIDAIESPGPATTEKLGLVKIGSGIKVTEDGTISATGGGGGGAANIEAGTGILINKEEDKDIISIDDTVLTTLNIPTATKTSKGIAQIGERLTVNEGTVDVPVASTTTLGVIRVGNNLSVDENGTMSVVDASGRPITSGEVVEAGQGIDVVHDSEAMSATVSVKYGKGLSVNSDNNTLNADVDSEDLQTAVNELNTNITNVHNEVVNLQDKTAGDIDTLTKAIQDVQTQCEDSEKTLLAVTDAIQDDVDTIHKQIDGDETADPPTPGLTKRVEDLETVLIGGSGQEGLDTRLTQLENTAITDVTPLDENVEVNIDGHRAEIGLTDSVTVQSLHLEESGHTVDLLPVAQEPEGNMLQVTVDGGNLAQVLVAEPTDSRGAVPLSIVETVRNIANEAVLDADNAKTTAEIAQDQAADAKELANNALKRNGDTTTGILTIGSQTALQLPRGSMNNIQGKISTPYSSSGSTVLQIGSTLATGGQKFIGFSAYNGTSAQNPIRLTGVDTPIQPLDAANKEYVDANSGIDIIRPPATGNTYSWNSEITQVLGANSGTVELTWTLYGQPVTGRFGWGELTITTATQITPKIFSGGPLFQYNVGASIDFPVNIYIMSGGYGYILSNASTTSSVPPLMFFLNPARQDYRGELTVTCFQNSNYIPIDKRCRIGFMWYCAAG